MVLVQEEDINSTRCASFLSRYLCPGVSLDDNDTLIDSNVLFSHQQFPVDGMQAHAML